MAKEQEAQMPKTVEYWETERLPKMHRTSPEFTDSLNKSYSSEQLTKLYEAPFLSVEQTEDQQFATIKSLVNLAFNKVPVYCKKYQEVGFEHGDLKTWEDYHKLPVITKDELIESFPQLCVDPDYQVNDLFPTRSSGSSGKTLKIYVDPQAIIIDTLQGIRQFRLQSGENYNEKHTIAHVYTVPWWVDSPGKGDYQNIFISSLIRSEEIGKILNEVKPDILSIYPTNLKSLLPFLSKEVRERLMLAVVHSEMSSKEERMLMAQEIGKPVYDEYSSEELTRIALELPCRHYHICEDAVRVDVVNPNNLQPTKKGTGLVVATNLLNKAMPFIKYVQGDFVTVGKSQECKVKWQQIEKIEGRQNDAFIRPDGVVIPAGTILDVTYRWMFDLGINIAEFELVQTSPRDITVNLKEPSLEANEDKKNKSHQHLQELLGFVMGNDINISFNLVKEINNTAGKRRPIKRQF